MTCFSNKALWFSARKMQSCVGYLSFCCSERGRNIKTAPTRAGSWASQKEHQENHRARYRGLCRMQEPEQGQSQHMKGCHRAKVLPLSPVSRQDVLYRLQNVLRLCHGLCREKGGRGRWVMGYRTVGESWFVSITSRLGPWVGSLLCWRQWQNSAIARLGWDSPSRAADTRGNLPNPTGGSPLWATTDSSLNHQGDTAFCCMCERLHQRGQHLVKQI